MAQKLFAEALALDPDSPEALIQSTFALGWALWLEGFAFRLTLGLGVAAAAGWVLVSQESRQTAASSARSGLPTRLSCLGEWTSRTWTRASR